jgi:ABC-type uncharacterized transport system ATPase subunit
MLSIDTKNLQEAQFQCYNATDQLSHGEIITGENPFCVAPEEAIDTPTWSSNSAPLTAINDTSLSGCRGDLRSFLAPQKCLGKTTTIRILTGSHRRPRERQPSSAKHRARDHCRAAVHGIFSETSNLNVDLATWQNLVFSEELYHVGRSERDRNATKLLKRFDPYERRRVRRAPVLQENHAAADHRDGLGNHVTTHALSRNVR